MNVQVCNLGLSVIFNNGDFTDCKSETLFIKCTTDKKTNAFESLTLLLFSPSLLCFNFFQGFKLASTLLFRVTVRQLEGKECGRRSHIMEVNDLRGGAAGEDLMVKWNLGRSPRSWRVLPKLLAVKCDAKMIVLTF
jgi:hypothetical protein